VTGAGQGPVIRHGRRKKGVVIPPTDGLLAATALRHGLHVMTRNTKHFEASGALIIDPWQGNG
jgi:predicted nucleic acid-binding protein